MRRWIWMIVAALAFIGTAVPSAAQEAFPESVRDGVVILRFADMTRPGTLRFEQMLAALDEAEQPYIVLDQRVRNQREAINVADRFNAIALLDGFQTRDGSFKMRVTWSTRAAQLLLSDTSASALDVVEEPITLTPDMPVTFVGDYLKGNIYYAFEDDANALRFLELAYLSLPRGQELASEALQLFVTYGIVLNRFGEYRRTLEVIEFAIELDPQFAYSYFVKARALRLLRRLEEALDTINRALELSNRAIYHSEQGRIFIQMERYDDARAAYERALQVSPNDPVAIVGLGDVAYFSGDIAGSIPFFQQAAEVDPTYSYAFYSLAYSYFDLEQFDNALRAVREALSIDPEYTDAVLLLADILYAQGRNRDAAAQYQRYLDLGGQPYDYIQERLNP